VTSGLFIYSEESHTSIVGMREYLLSQYKPLDRSSNLLVDDNNSRRNGKIKTSSPYFLSSSKKGNKVFCLAKAALEKLLSHPPPACAEKSQILKDNGIETSKKMYEITILDWHAYRNNKLQLLSCLQM
jgi:hypothetical protein